MFELVAIAQGQPATPAVSAHIATCTACLHIVIIAASRGRTDETNPIVGYLIRTRGDA